MGADQILLVEDNRDDVSLTLRAFELHGIPNPVVVKHDAEEALSYLFCQKEPDGSRPEALAMVILDIGLPKLDGWEVLAKIREDPRLKNVPVVILSASDREEDVRRGYDLGANSYVHKAVDFNEFANEVAALTVYWTLINQMPSTDGSEHPGIADISALQDLVHDLTTNAKRADERGLTAVSRCLELAIHLIKRIDKKTKKPKDGATSRTV